MAKKALTFAERVKQSAKIELEEMKKSLAIAEAPAKQEAEAPAEEYSEKWEDE